MRYARGDVIRFTGSHLRSIGWYTGVPINGVVLGQEGERLDGESIYLVKWCDRENLMRVPGNALEPCPKAMREAGQVYNNPALAAEFIKEERIRE